MCEVPNSMNKIDDLESQEDCSSGEMVVYKPPFESVVCDLFSIDFEEGTITICVPSEIMKHGIHAGRLTIDFRPITEIQQKSR